MRNCLVRLGGRAVTAKLTLASCLLAGIIALQVCGIPPIPPIPSLGCKEMVPVCVCLENGRCFWQFQCVPA